MYTNNGDIVDNSYTIYNNNFYSSSDGTAERIYNWDKQLTSIVERVPTEINRIKPLIQLIATAIAPSKIYMMKHPDVGTHIPDKYIDLLIVISSKSNTSFTESQPILDMAYLNDCRVDCSLHSEGNIIDGLRNGHFFYSLQCIPDNLIYDDKLTVYPVTPPEILQEKKGEAYLKFEQNFANALDFHEGAAYPHENNTSRITGFMLHQAVELTFRGILQSLNGYDKKTHEIRVLRKYVRRCAPQLYNIFSGDSEEEKRLLDILENAYSHARYENNYQIPDEDLTTLFEKVIRLQETAQKVAHAVLRPD